MGALQLFTIMFCINLGLYVLDLTDNSDAINPFATIDRGNNTFSITDDAESPMDNSTGTVVTTSTSLSTINTFFLSFGKFLLFTGTGLVAWDLANDIGIPYPINVFIGLPFFFLTTGSLIFLIIGRMNG